MTSDRPSMLTTTQVADELGCSRRLVVDLIKAGELRAMPLGRTYRVHPADLEAFVSRRATRATA